MSWNPSAPDVPELPLVLSLTHFIHEREYDFDRGASVRTHIITDVARFGAHPCIEL